MKENRLSIFLRNSCLWYCMGLIELLMFCLTACSDDDEPYSQESAVPQVTLLFPINGLGDRSYSDNIYEGAYRAKARIRLSQEVDFIEYVPTSTAEAETFMAAWMNNSHHARRLLIVCEPSFTSWMDKHPEWTSTPDSQILWIDVDEESERYHTRYISLYGVSYMAGKAVTLMGIERSAIVLANPENAPLLEASAGFFDGQQVGGGFCSPSEDVYLLAEHAGEGFDAQDKLFNLAYQLEQSGYRFVFPVCGGSSQGLYSYTRTRSEGAHDTFYTCGLDVDQQAYSKQVAFSLLKRYDQMVEDYLLDWAEEQPCESWLYGDIANGYATFVVSDFYSEDLEDTPQWEALTNEAIQAELNYRNRKNQK